MLLCREFSALISDALMNGGQPYTRLPFIAGKKTSLNWVSSNENPVAGRGNVLLAQEETLYDAGSQKVKNPGHETGVLRIGVWRCATLTWGNPTLPSPLTCFTSEFG
ncbi:hypothetical protein ACFODS_14520, partial [Alteromonas sediminis]|uniref:hypothetical protein n=1 Tax=Alteromonas sediminis TaxID=2259342 RepID=UPI003607D696